MHSTSTRLHCHLRLASIYPITVGLDGQSLYATIGNIVLYPLLYPKVSYPLINTLHLSQAIPLAVGLQPFLCSTQYLPSALLTSSRHLSFLCLSLIERSSIPPIAITAILVLKTASCHLICHMFQPDLSV